ncbi:MAG: hypothetical protein R3359_04030 [Marinirhabdus sp.]|nr:hypothetical protein [Marinirhabdus sp.]
MDWKVINGITGLISAICAIAGIGYFSSHKRTQNDEESSNLLSTERLVSFVIASSGWALSCLSFLWVTEPYGAFPSDKEFRHFFGVILGFPALILFFYGFDLLINGVNSRKNKEAKQNDKE